MTNDVFFYLGFLFAFIVPIYTSKGNNKDVKWKDDPRIEGIKWVFITIAFLLVSESGELIQKALPNAPLIKWQLTLQLLKGMAWGFGSYFVISSVYISIVYGFRYTGAYHWNGIEYVKEEIECEKDDGFRKYRILTNASLEYLSGLILDKSSPADFSHKRSSILKGIAELSKYYVTDDHTQDEGLYINANFMQLLTYDTNNPQIVEMTKFRFGDEARYKQILHLKEYAHQNISVPADFALPIEDVSQDGWETRVLPGAPHSYCHKTSTILETDNIDFAVEIPAQTKEDIVNYFKNQQFKCIITLPIPVKDHENNLVGVVNIETNRTKIVEDKGLIEDLVLKVNPYLALLGTSIETE